jgi:hypothetical protein
MKNWGYEELDMKKRESEKLGIRRIGNPKNWESEELLAKEGLRSTNENSCYCAGKYFSTLFPKLWDMPKASTIITKSLF